MLLHQMLAGRKEEANSASTLERIHSDARRGAALAALCKCVVKYTKRGKSRVSCHIRNRAPVAYLMSPRHHPLLLPHISGFMFVNFPPVARLVLAASSPTPARGGKTTGERSQFRLSQTENMEIRRRTVGPLRTPPPVSASCHSLTDKLTF